MNAPRVLAAVLLASMLLAGCGDAPTFPTPGPCPSPVAPTRPANRPLQGESDWREVLFAGIDQLTKLASDFRAKWPDGTFSRDPAFRTDFATYADRSTCVAQEMLSAQPPADAAPTFVEAFDGAVRQFINSQAVARDGVKTRNVTTYRDWYDDIDAELNAIRDTFRQFPMIPFENPIPRTAPRP